MRLSPDADTTAAERESITAAIGMWREVGLETLVLEELAPGSAEFLPLQFKNASSFFHGVYEPESGRVLVNRGLAGSERDVTVAHEVGHALGLPHVDRAVRRSVMNPSNLTVRPAPEDEAELERLWGCSLQNSKPSLPSSP